MHLSPTSIHLREEKKQQLHPVGEGLVDHNGANGKLLVVKVMIMRIKAMKRLSIQTTYLSVFH